MITPDALQRLIGRTAYGPDGSKIGSVGTVYLDNATGAPAWVTVRTGLFGTKASFVPLEGAELAEDGLRLPYDKDRVKGAPNLDADQELSPDEEYELYSYYGLGVGRTADEAAGLPEAPAPALSPEQVSEHGGEYRGELAEVPGDRRDPADADLTAPTVPDDAMTRSEEQVRTGTERVVTGRVRLRKYVVTEERQITVPVRREVVRLEYEPVTGSDPLEAGEVASGTGADALEPMVLSEERIVVTKETVPVERVRLAKETVEATETVDVDVRKEQIEALVDRDDDRDDDRDGGLPRS